MGEKHLSTYLSTPRRGYRSGRGIWRERHWYSVQEIGSYGPRHIEIKYVTGTKVYLDDSGETVITIAYVEIPDSHQPRIIGSFAASSSVAEAYCRQLMEVLGIKEREWPNGRDPKES
jgi:hypothetical protein